MRFHWFPSCILKWQNMLFQLDEIRIIFNIFLCHFLLIFLFFFQLKSCNLLKLSSSHLLSRLQHVLSSVESWSHVRRDIDCRVLSGMSESSSSVCDVVGLKFEGRNFEFWVFDFLLHQVSEIFSILRIHVFFLCVEDIVVKRAFFHYAFHSFGGYWKLDFLSKYLWEVGFVLCIWLLSSIAYSMRERNIVSFVVSFAMEKSSLRLSWVFWSVCIEFH